VIGLDEIKQMLTRFEEADSNGELENEGSGALKALRWVTGDADYAEMDDMLPEEEVCEDCGDANCSGAAGGECDDAEDGPIEVIDPEKFQIDLGLKGDNK
jgi:hypothetical protein